eukprot:COSAG04_NODE_28995_length_272_cov_0.595376_2_plen_58_part_01
MRRTERHDMYLSPLPVLALLTTFPIKRRRCRRRYMYEQATKQQALATGVDQMYEYSMC